MFNQALLPDTFRAIQLVSTYPEIKSAYLAGGTALAIQIGHRISVDLDFFTLETFDENILSQELSKHPEFKEERKAWRTILGQIGETKFSIFFYKYPLVDKTVEFSGIKLASLSDVAAMKLNAITDRGTKRDFIDLYFLAKQLSLEQMLKFYSQKYGNLEEQFYTLTRALDYFEDADREEIEPRMLIPISWPEVKKFFQTESIHLAKNHFQI